MIKIEHTKDRLELQSGSTKIVLDKQAGEAVLQRKLLFWARKPQTCPLNSVSRVRLDASVDPASRAEVCKVILQLREGGGWALPADDRMDATAAVSAVRDFRGISE